MSNRGEDSRAVANMLPDTYTYVFEMCGSLSALFRWQKNLVEMPIRLQVSWRNHVRISAPPASQDVAPIHFDRVFYSIHYYFVNNSFDRS